MPDEPDAERAERRKRLQFMCNSKDPDAVKCRLYLTGIQTKYLQRNDIAPLFAPFGKVYDIAIHPGYVFIQYDNLESSLSAIGKLDNTKFKESTMALKLAEKGKRLDKADKEVCRFFQRGGCMRGNSCNYLHVNAHGLDTRSANSQQGGGRDQSRDRGRSESIRGKSDDVRGSRPVSSRPRDDDIGLPGSHGGHRSSDRDRKSVERPLLPIPAERPSKRLHDPEVEDYGKRPRASDYSSAAPVVSERGRGRPSLDDEYRRPLPVSPRSHISDPMLTPQRREAPPVDLRPPYDCVLIAGHETQRSYCNAINKRLSEFGMLTNVQVVNGEHLLKRAVEEAARHTVPYTICVTANNEEHRSLTLNILHGVAQEHRNMPLEDAMPFLSRNFDKFVEMMKKKISTINQWEPPDAKNACFLNLLAEGRRITLAELQEVDKYIQVLIEKLKASEAAWAKSSRLAGLREDAAHSSAVPRVYKEEDRRVNRLFAGREQALTERERLLLERDRRHISGEREVSGRERELLKKEPVFLDRPGIDRELDLVGRERGLPGRDRMITEQSSKILDRARRDASEYGAPMRSEEGYSRNEDRFTSRNGSQNSASQSEINLESPAVKRVLSDLLSSSRGNAGQNSGSRRLF